MVVRLAIRNTQGQDTKRLRLAFREHLIVLPGTESQLAAALTDTLSRPGNLVRAELAFKVAMAFGAVNAVAEQLAIALEYFHTASLLLDDLPSMDDAVHRRGDLCLHQLYGEATTILAALGLINRAYALVWSAMKELPAQTRSDGADYLEQHLGLRGVLNGQSRDIHFGDPNTSSDSAQRIALEKTASLIRLSLVLPAIIGGASVKERTLLDRLAKLWGLNYQGLDDVKDILGQQQQTGKTTGRDQVLRRPNAALELGTELTLVRLHRLRSLSSRTLQHLLDMKPELSFLQEIEPRFDEERTEVLKGSEPSACCI